MPRSRRTTFTAALLLVGLAVGGPALPTLASAALDALESKRSVVAQPAPAAAGSAADAAAGAHRAERCVSAAELAQVQVGMSVPQAQRLLVDRDVWWGPATGSWSQSFPVACSDTRAMLIQADEGRITVVVNEGEQPASSCTTTAEFDRIEDGMSRRAVARLLRGKDVDLRRADRWEPVPCLRWSTQRVSFRDGRVTDHVRSFYFG